MKETKLEIGQRLWRFDPNRRKYRSKGRISSDIIYSYHFEPVWVVGETPRSWILAAGESWERVSEWYERAKDDPRYLSRLSWKLPKKNTDIWGRMNVTVGGYFTHFFTDEQKRGELWKHQHRHKILQLIDHGNLSADQWKQIAKIVEYEYDETESDIEDEESD